MRIIRSIFPLRLSPLDRPDSSPAALRDIGIDISKRQLMRRLIAGQDGFVTEAREVLRAGLETARCISVDDTGAGHAGANATCTQIGNRDFTWFGTTAGKSRLNFLGLLRAGHGDYVVNDAALDYMRDRALAGPLITRLAGSATRHFASATDWAAHLDRLVIHGLEGSLAPARVATEGALWGSIAAHGLLQGAVIVSDDAGQFDVGRHALCWVHAEHLVHRLDTFTDEQRVSCIRFPWTPICPRRDRNDDVQHEEDRSSFSC